MNSNNIGGTQPVSKNTPKNSAETTKPVTFYPNKEAGATCVNYQGANAKEYYRFDTRNVLVEIYSNDYDNEQFVITQADAARFVTSNHPYERVRIDYTDDTIITAYFFPEENRLMPDIDGILTRISFRISALCGESMELVAGENEKIARRMTGGKDMKEIANLLKLSQDDFIKMLVEHKEEKPTERKMEFADVTSEYPEVAALGNVEIMTANTSTEVEAICIPGKDTTHIMIAKWLSKEQATTLINKLLEIPTDENYNLVHVVAFGKINTFPLNCSKSLKGV